MTAVLQFLQPVWAAILYILIGAMCVGGLGLSVLTLSGTWLIALAAVLALLLPEATFPGGWTIGLFLVISAAVEGIEAVAGALGVKRRGGSTMAGVAAFVGGLLGLVLGTFIPIPVVGSLVGMIVGSFVLVFLVEQRRLKRSDQAAHIAWGSVIGRLFVMLVKVVTTLGMIVYLWVGLVRG